MHAHLSEAVVHVPDPATDQATTKQSVAYNSQKDSRMLLMPLSMAAQLLVIHGDYFGSCMIHHPVVLEGGMAQSPCVHLRCHLQVSRVCLLLSVDATLPFL